MPDRSVQPGEAGIEAVAYVLHEAPPEADLANVARAAIAAYLSADPASALRAVLRHPEAREALREMLTSERSVWVIFTDGDYEPTDVVAEREDGDTLPNERAVEYVPLSAVDALASGVERNNCGKPGHVLCRCDLASGAEGERE